jgi:hypothetical protein
MVYAPLTLNNLVGFIELQSIEEPNYTLGTPARATLFIVLMKVSTLQYSDI